MAISYPAISYLRGYDTNVDLVDSFDRGFNSGKSIADELAAPDLLRRLYGDGAAPQSLSDLDAHVRAMSAMHGGQRSARPASDQLIDDSFDAAASAVDPALRQSLAARYPGSKDDGRTAVAMLSDLGQMLPDGLDAYAANVARAESGGDPQARNPRSSATGVYQFTRPTWEGLMADPSLGLTLDGITDPVQQQRAMRALTLQNAKALSAAGIKPNPGSLYAAHFLGAGDAPRVLSAPADTPMTALLSPAVIEANPTLADMSAADFRSWASAKGSGTGGGYRGPMLSSDGAIPLPSRQVPRPDGEMIAALFANRATRPLAQALMAQSSKSVDQWQTFTGTDGVVYQANLLTGETKVLRDASKAPQVTSQYDPATGREQKLEWDAAAGDWKPLGGTKAQSDANGFSLTMPDGTVIQQGGKGINAYDVEDAKAKVKLGTEIADNGRAGTAQLATLSKMRDLLSNDAVYTGIGGEQVQALQRFGKLFGVDTGIEDTESFNALSKAAVLDRMGGSLGTGVSNADRTYIDQQMPGLQNTKAGNLQLIQIMEKLASRQVDIAKFAAQYKATHGGRLDFGFDDALASWAEQNPLFAGDAGPGGGSSVTLPDPLQLRN